MTINKKFKKAVLISLIIISQLGNSFAQNNEKFVVNILEGEVILKFDKVIFFVDTMKTVEGHIYTISFPDDSSYIRINPISNSTFQCCNDNNYITNYDTVMMSISDRRGWIDGTALYWREIRFEDFEFIYNYVGGKKQKFMNELFDDVIKQVEATSHANAGCKPASGKDE